MLFLFGDPSHPPPLHFLLQKCLNQPPPACENFSKASLHARREERKCHDCAEEALKKVTEKKSNMGKCTFFDTCENLVDISMLSKKQKKNVRSGHTKLCCNMCQQQGRTSRDQEPLQKCVHPEPSQICKQFGRYQAKKRFAKGGKECLLCRGCHTPCRKCSKLVDIKEEADVNKYDYKHGRGHKLCDNCVKAGHTTRDLRSYECRSPGCGQEGGRELFDTKSVDHFLTGQVKPICLKCKKKRKS